MKFGRPRSFSDLGTSHTDSLFSSYLYLQTARSIEAKWHVEPPWNQQKKKNKESTWLHDLYGQHIQENLKSSSLLPKSWWSRKLLCSIVYPRLPSLSKGWLGWPWSTIKGHNYSPLSKLLPLKMEKMCWVWNVIAVLFVKIVPPDFQKIYSILITLNNLACLFLLQFSEMPKAHIFTSSID